MKPNPKQWQKVVKAVRHCQGLTLIEMIGVLEKENREVFVCVGA